MKNSAEITILTYQEFQKMAECLRANLYSMNNPVIDIEDNFSVSYDKQDNTSFNLNDPSQCKARIRIQFTSRENLEAFDTVFDRYKLLIIDPTATTTSNMRVLNWAVCSQDYFTKNNIINACEELSTNLNPIPDQYLPQVAAVPIPIELPDSAVLNTPSASATILGSTTSLAVVVEEQPLPSIFNAQQANLDG